MFVSIDFIIILVPFFSIVSEERLVDKGSKLFCFLPFGRTEQLVTAHWCTGRSSVFRAKQK